jgi:cyclopropane-fatty-acyl-phospholipid synthase
MKYSCALYETGSETLAEAEEKMLALTCERARLKDGQDILELGCGWGSLTLWMAEKYPNSRITAVSNSRTQKQWIDSQLEKRGWKHVRIITRDMNDFEADASAYDRVVSVEMFEHMRNYELLLEKISRWLRPSGHLFVHIFVHARFPYLFEAKSDSDWMSRYFFTGGQMPSDDLLSQFQSHLRLSEQWRVNGRHYELTAEDWLRNMDKNGQEIEPLLSSAYGSAQVRQWRVYWRVFYMSCAELWGFSKGQEWFVSHYLFTKP